MIPIIIVCYNNYKYVENTVNQLVKINDELLKFIYIMDNCSSCEETKTYLKNCGCQVIYNKSNNGPWITETNNTDVYNQMPNEFILTDPDLQFNENLPKNFIEILLELSHMYQVHKIGFALDISSNDEMYYTGQRDWETQFWQNRYPNDTYELYVSEIDTTFCVINKSHKPIVSGYGSWMRIAGNFTAKHLPWYINNPIYNHYELYKMEQSSAISTIKRHTTPYFEKTYTAIQKRDELFLIRKEDIHNDWWCTTYPSWENETFDIFDRFLKKDKIFIDVGGWVGTTAMYGSRKSKHVYSVEADYKAFEEMKKNLITNCTTNYTLIYNAIYNKDDTQVMFGKNKHIPGSELNGSVSQINIDTSDTENFYPIQTITLRTLVKDINPLEISLIKVDIEGGEEFILEDLFNFHKEFNTPVYVSFHYSWWNDKNIDRFSFLTDEQKKKVLADPFVSLLFV